MNSLTSPVVTLYLGDCSDVLAALPENSIDSVVCDPPYGLTQNKRGGSGLASLNLASPAGRSRVTTGGGFMGKEWDAGIPDVEYWAAILRAAKPGAHLVAFGGTRTFHRLAVAIEDAGWEIRDTLMWVYGCLSEDTEILTSEGWEPYHTLIAGKRALCYNPEGDTFQWEPIQDVFTYDYKDTAYRIRSDRTDQLVSRNHRCLVERGGRTVYEYAEALQRQERVPVLEDLCSLLASLPVPYERASDAQSDVQPEMCEYSQRTKTDGKAPRSAYRAEKNSLLGLWQGAVATRERIGQGKCSSLRVSLQRYLARARMGATRAQGPGVLDTGERSGHQKKNDRPKQPRLEGRSNLLQDARQLCRRQVRALSSRIRFNGAQGRLCQGASIAGSSSHRASAVAFGSCASYRPRSQKQQPRQSPTFRQQSGSQTIRASRFTRSDLATVTPVYYEGVVWCVSVPSGAFVARRNGYVFVTGNSGFPKSLDVSKAIDKAATDERSPTDQMAADERKANPNAEHWAGWGTALKPSWEPIILARKPFPDTVASNVLEWGTGAMFIDGARVETDDVGTAIETPERERDDGWGMGFGSVRDGPASPAGRWPPNFLLDGSDEVRALFPRAGAGSAARFYPILSLDAEDVEAARIFYCAKASNRDRNEGLEDLPARSNAERAGRNMGRNGRAAVGGSGKPLNGTGLVDPKPNHHPTVKPTALMRWLVRLVTPRGGTVLDPFMGSGSTGKAAVIEDFNFIGIEREAEYLEIARRRIDAARLPLFAIEASDDPAE